MKKLKTILSTAMLAVLSLSLATGCNKPEDPETPDTQTPGSQTPGNQTPGSQTTLSLSEAKNLINGSLALDVSTLSSGESEGNRNIFVKLGTVEFNFSGENESNIITGLMNRSGEAWSKYSLENFYPNEPESETLYGYFDGEYEYTKMGTNYSKAEYGDSYFALMAHALDAIYVDILFEDAAWDSIYNSTATKNATATGYVVTLDVNMANYVDYVNSIYSSEGLFGDGESLQMNKDDGSVTLTVTFDNSNNILGLNFGITTYSFSGDISSATLTNSTISISKYTGEINEPSWFNPEDYQ